MKLGNIVVIGMVLLCAVTAVTLPEKKEEIDLTQEWHTLNTYKNKLMYSEAISQYKSIINQSEPESRYELYIELRDYCKENGEDAAYIDACRSAVALNPSDYLSAEAVLQSLDESKKIYPYIHELLDSDGISEEAYNYYSNYYDSIKGRYYLSTLKVADAGEWCLDSFAYAAYDDENDCIINTDGEIIIQPLYGKIDSYSPDSNYIAAVHENQKVYINTENRRKLVPYDYSDDSLIYCNYLGRFSNGLANYCSSDNKWGYLTSSMTEKYSGFDAATPLTDGFFAVKSDGVWQIIYHSSSADTVVYSCDELYLDGDQFISKCFTDSVNKTKTCYFYAGNGNQKWNLVKLILDFSGKELAASAETPGNTAFDDVKLFGDGFGAVMSGGSWCFTDSSGSVVSTMGTYSDARSMSCRYCAVMDSSGNWGYIDANGKYIIDPIFEEAHSLSSSGTAAVLASDGWKLLRLEEYR